MCCHFQCLSFEVSVTNFWERTGTPPIIATTGLTFKRHCYIVNSWQGIITEETRDSFNLPTYIPHVEEVRDSINATGGFEIIRLELLEDRALYPDDARLSMIRNPKKCAKFYSSWVRSLVEPLMVVHMGADCTDEWFVRHERRIYARCRAMQGNPLEQEQYKFLSADFLLIVLKKQ